MTTATAVTVLVADNPRIDAHATSAGALQVTVGPLTLLVPPDVWERLIDTSRPALATLRRRRDLHAVEAGGGPRPDTDGVLRALASVGLDPRQDLPSSADLDWRDHNGTGRHRGRQMPPWIENALPAPTGRHK